MKKYFLRYVLSGRAFDRVQVKVFASVVFLQPAKKLNEKQMGGLLA